MYRLQEITAMKLNMIKQLQDEIKVAIDRNWPNYRATCEKELIQTKYEAMHPQEVLSLLQSRYKLD